MQRTHNLAGVCTTCGHEHVALDDLLSTAIQQIGSKIFWCYVPDTWVRAEIESRSTVLRWGSIEQFRRAVGRLAGFGTARDGWVTSVLHVYKDNITARDRVFMWQCSPHPYFPMFSFTVADQLVFLRWLSERAPYLREFRKLTMYGRSPAMALQWPEWKGLLLQALVEHRGFVVAAASMIFDGGKQVDLTQRPVTG